MTKGHLIVNTLACIYALLFGLSSANEGENKLGSANQGFAISLYKKLADENPGKNVFFSPISISLAFGILNIGARGDTQTQTKSVLHLNKLNSDDEINDGFKQFTEKVISASNNNYTLHLANRLFGSDKFVIKNEFLEKAQQYFQATLEKLNFKEKAEESRVHINKWVEKQTNDKIKNLLPGGSVDMSTILVIVNAIYFKADWLLQFEKNHTRSADFHISKLEKVQMDQMYLSAETLNYHNSKELDCEVFELPYDGSEISMFVFLPREIEGLSKLEEKLTDETLIHAVRSVQGQKFDVRFPKFQMDQDISLKRFLKSLGMVDLFGNTCDLSGITDGGKLVVSDAIHKAFVSVDEVGTEAAAATAIGVKFLSLPRTIRVDHPFLFMIFEKRTENILFFGRLVRPPTSNDSIGKFGETAAVKAGVDTTKASSTVCLLVAVLAVFVSTVFRSIISM